ncbi:MAG: LysM peptidoglycan-binding domain-containing protein [Treponema sp.]|nr:LysM peptidoglycan-binding domain-containing protein [Treponema sp.]
MASNIGIKIANGEFYPIMEENSSIKKRLILTTVHDNQPSVQIDLYRSQGNTMPDAQYIGSLVVENIKAKPKGEPSIEMVISSDSNGDIVADAIDLDTGAGGEHYVLSVSLKSLDETSRGVDLPDFELESNEEPPSGLYNNKTKTKVKKEKSKSSAGLIILLLLLLLLGGLALWLFLFGGMDTVRPLYNKYFNKAPVEQSSAFEPVRKTDPAPVPEPEPVRQDEPVKQVIEPPPVIQAPIEPAQPRQSTTRKGGGGRNPPVASYNVPATIPREGVDYRIRWGDTLWDIADAFYRDPWQYPRIARHNNIRNPNLIISGRTIRVPPRN